MNSLNSLFEKVLKLGNINEDANQVKEPTPEEKGFAELLYISDIDVNSMKANEMFKRVRKRNFLNGKKLTAENFSKAGVERALSKLLHGDDDYMTKN